MFQKIIAFFKKSNKDRMKAETSKATTVYPVKHRKVEPAHIGDLGEYKIDVQLRLLSKENRYLNDLLLINPKSKTGYSQIDHVLITRYGLFVVETKNWYGKITGNRRDKSWTVNGRYPKPNPLRQNYGHVKTLEAILNGYKGIKFVSIISFTKRCELYLDQELREIESDELVVYDIKFTDYIERKLRRLKIESPNPPLTESDVISIFELITARNITDAKARADHIKKAKGGTVTKVRG